MTDTANEPQTAEEFLDEARRRDPQRFAALAARYPINSDYDEQRFRLGESPWRKRNREGLKGAPPKRRFSDEEWAIALAATQQGRREWELDYALAKEQAQGVY